MAAASPILIVTRRDDLTADFVIQRLLERDVAYLRFDVDHFLDDVFLEASVGSDGLAGEVSTPQGSASLDSIAAVWYRRAMRPELSKSPFGKVDHDFAKQEAMHFLEGTLGALSATWINSWQAVYAWERKLLQLPLAAACGLSIPSTIVSTNPDRIRRFAKSLNTIAKTLSWGLIPTTDGIEAIYTHSLSGRTIADEEAVRKCPTLIQDRVEKIADIRLTVIGDQLFGARLDAVVADGLDWRRPGTPVTYTPVEVPVPIRDGVKKMMKSMKLVYGAFDFGLTADGAWIFFEVNPTGEFAWLETECGWPLRDALIDTLLGQ